MARRERHPDPAGASAEIWRRLTELTEFTRAETILCYVARRGEVETRAGIERILREGKRVFVPFCAGDQLRLFRLEDWDELAPGHWRILEPKAELRSLADRQARPEDLNWAIVPGVAFDPRGARLGHGRGYFDRFLPSLPPEVPAVGLAFDCQIFPELPTLPYDVFMDWVITESGTYRGYGRCHQRGKDVTTDG